VNSRTHIPQLSECWKALCLSSITVICV
jgi:hypothetical protein